jgi:uncharacterized cupredoxin-like copper-binding protein
MGTQRSSFALAAAALILMLVACGPGGGGTPTPGEQTVEVELGEWFVRPTPASVPAGMVQFNARNVGQVEHELIVLKTDLQPDALPKRAEDQTRVDEDASGELIGEIEPDELGPGEEASATYNLQPGAYVLLCNLPAHYELGMFVGFSVE